MNSNINLPANQKKPKGLFMRDGVWVINKIVNKHRIYLSTKTSDINVAINILENALPVSEPLVQNKIHWEAIVKAADEKGSPWLKNRWRGIRNRAYGKDGWNTLTYEDFIAVMLRSGGKCEVTGIAFNVDHHPDGRAHPFAPSIDRIDSAKGYSTENCRVVCYSVNLAMSNWGEGVIERIASAYIGRKIAPPPARKKRRKVKKPKP